MHFNPLPPYGGRPSSKTATCRHWKISIHSLRMEGDIRWIFQNGGQCISIHSLRMEGDPAFITSFLPTLHFNPLPPYGGRPIFGVPISSPSHFNPLPPYGGRLRTSSYPPETVHYFNPLPPYGGRPLVAFCETPLERFQSTPSVWRETRYGYDW